LTDNNTTVGALGRCQGLARLFAHPWKLMSDIREGHNRRNHHFYAKIR